MVRLFFLLLFLAPLACHAGSSVADDEGLPPRIQHRANRIFGMTRCLVCAGESIRESQSSFAVSIRGFIWSEILNGRTDDEILADLRDRYGEQILGTTPYEGRTYFLWMLPLLVSVALSAMVAIKLRRLKSQGGG
ncbi:cytochrome c-type biogenesis protein [Anaplasma capra]|uniref:cytochrome c-type biogenesis protein n=1 Tax=Anaplasma capra TaxID=1562740 RepID=UPI0021D5BF5B|nr:cytochrome c-type biogenesis protein CcmH [Anaplasma capra]MCU7611625.1 cytochrome c-type biogenesis protein CcmH [Anaplasma capra]MCU7612227.1 cytochrome c-type biogenesis protein CcmH [Anaplasma capra]